MKQTIIQNYTNRVENFKKQKRELQKINNWIALIRLMLFLAAGLVMYFLLNSGSYNLSVLVFVISFLVFLYLVKVHADYKNRKNHSQALIQINENELKFQAGDLSPFESGKIYDEAEHPYIFDLDIFGQNSIYQLINRTTTSIGAKMLADWLKSPFLDQNIILQNQAAAQELGAKLDWRQNFQAYGQLWQETLEEKEDLIAWLKEPTKIIQKPLYKVILWVFPVIATICLVLVILGLLEIQFLFLIAVIQLMIVSLHIKTLLRHSLQISKKTKLLRKYAQLFKQIENEEFKSDKLIHLRQKLLLDQTSAHKQLKNLSEIVNNMEQGGSFVGMIFNGLFLWSLQFLYRLEHWQLNYKDRLNDWFEVAGTIDALASMGNLHGNRPEYIFPEPIVGQFELEGELVGHPLLSESISVKNNILFSHTGQLWIITGANMAGKSTYLRTIGVNLVLAMIGAPVCAQRFKFSPMEIYTSMRTRDSLQSNESFFYAELKKLKKIIDQLNGQKTIFVILDEILKGTNSLDQHTGSKALIEQLVKLGAVGLIATHDLSLGELENIYPKNIQNKCFEIEIIDQELAFDYKLRDGINQNLNATFLMKKMGITV